MDSRKHQQYLMYYFNTLFVANYKVFKLQLCTCKLSKIYIFLMLKHSLIFLNVGLFWNYLQVLFWFFFYGLLLCILLICASQCLAFKGSTINKVMLKSELCTILYLVTEMLEVSKNVSKPVLTLTQLLKTLSLKDCRSKVTQVPTWVGQIPNSTSKTTCLPAC